MSSFKWMNLLLLTNLSQAKAKPSQANSQSLGWGCLYYHYPRPALPSPPAELIRAPTLKSTKVSCYSCPFLDSFHSFIEDFLRVSWVYHANHISPWASPKLRLGELAVEQCTYDTLTIWPQRAYNWGKKIFNVLDNKFATRKQRRHSLKSTSSIS